MCVEKKKNSVYTSFAVSVQSSSGIASSIDAICLSTCISNVCICVLYIVSTQYNSFRFSLLSFQQPVFKRLWLLLSFYYLFGALKCASLNRNLITNVIITMNGEEHSHSYSHIQQPSVDVVVFFFFSVVGIGIIIVIVRLSCACLCVHEYMCSHQSQEHVMT